MSSNPSDQLVKAFAAPGTYFGPRPRHRRQGPRRHDRATRSRSRRRPATWRRGSASSGTRRCARAPRSRSCQLLRPRQHRLADAGVGPRRGRPVRRRHGLPSHRHVRHRRAPMRSESGRPTRTAASARSTRRSRCTGRTASPRIRIVSGTGDAGAPVTLRPGEAVSLYSGVSDSDDPVVDWAWDVDADGEFDDGSEVPKSVSFADAGLHRVYLRGTDSGGLSGVGVRLVDVAPERPNRAPAVRLVLPGGVVAPGVPVDLAVSATDPDGDELSFAWDADGDGAFDDGAARTISFVYPGPAATTSRSGSRTRAARRARCCRRSWSTPRPASRRCSRSCSTRRCGSASRRRSRCSWPAGPVHLHVRPRRRRAVRRHAGGTFGNYVWTFPTATPVTVSVRATDPGGRVLDAVAADHARGPRTSRRRCRDRASATRFPGSPCRCRRSTRRRRVLRGAASPGTSTPTGSSTTARATASAPTFGPGTHTVSVRVTDGEGATAVASRTIVSARGRRWRISPSRWSSRSASSR